MDIRSKVYTDNTKPNLKIRIGLDNYGICMSIPLYEPSTVLKQFEKNILQIVNREF